MKEPPSQGEIDRLLSELVIRFPNIHEIWLIGSRANCTARPDSDWDLLIFGDDRLHAQITRADDLHRVGVDCLVLINEDRLITAWGPKKSLSLSGSEWRRVSSERAVYTEVKARDQEDEAGLVWESRERVGILKYAAAPIGR